MGEKEGEKERQSKHTGKNERGKSKREGGRERMRECARVREKISKYEDIYIFSLYCTRVRGNVRIYIEKNEKICIEKSALE